MTVKVTQSDLMLTNNQTGLRIIFYVKPNQSGKSENDCKSDTIGSDTNKSSNRITYSIYIKTYQSGEGENDCKCDAAGSEDDAATFAGGPGRRAGRAASG